MQYNSRQKHETELRTDYEISIRPTVKGYRPVLMYEGNEVWLGDVSDDRTEAFDQAFREFETRMDRDMEKYDDLISVELKNDREDREALYGWKS